MFNLSRKDFDLDRIGKIIELSKTSPVTALGCIESYCKKYPYDVWGYANYARLLISNDRLDEAQEKLNKAVYLYDNNYFFFMHPEKSEGIVRELLHAQLKIYAFKNDAVSFLKLYSANREALTNLGDEVVFYYNYLAGNLSFTDVPIGYTKSQMVEYSEDRLINCIRFRTAHVNGENKESITRYFNEDVDIKELLGKVKDKLPETKKINHGFIYNSYVFKCDGCGKTSDGEDCNYFKVYTLTGTDNIVEMFPVSEPSDVEFGVIERKKEEVKSYNMAEKFRRRYGITTA